MHSNKTSNFPVCKINNTKKANKYIVMVEGKISFSYFAYENPAIESAGNNLDSIEFKADLSNHIRKRKWIPSWCRNPKSGLDKQPFALLAGWVITFSVKIYLPIFHRECWFK